MYKMDTAKIRSGALSLALHTSRIAGVAPLSFKKLRNGYIISITHFQLAYSFFIITAFNVIGLTGLYWNIKNKWFDDFQSHFMTLLIICERMSYILGCGMGYMGASRMKNMINHINIVEKIRTKINSGYNSTKEDTNVMWISFLLIISAVMNTLLEMTFTIMRTSYFDHSTTAHAQLIKNGVRSLTQSYVSVYDVVTKINNTEGFYMFLVYTCFALLTGSDGYRLVDAFNIPSGTPYRWADIIFQSNWCVMSILREFYFVDPFQRISVQVSEMKVLLTQLMYKMTPLGHHVSQELDIMFKQVMLNVPQYCPLGINTLNRSLVTITFVRVASPRTLIKTFFFKVDVQPPWSSGCIGVSL